MVKICRTTVLRGPAVRRSGCLQVPAAHDLNVERARVRVRSHLSRAVADERTMPPRPNNKKGAEHAVDPGAALTVLGASDELRQREERLEQLEREIAVKEACLASGDAAAATGDPVLGARWQCLAQEKAALAHRWACLAAEKTAQADKERLVLQAAFAGGAPVQQHASREGEPLLGGARDAPALQHTYCAVWSVQQIQWISLGQQQQQTDSPFASCCFQR